ncbi:hypothetical protein AV530_014088 [Patagioenas fasciata monilis]|uniref:Uncharacterized protein n=1 Tax=Patagioenas fasciata monilis TaxID=372326 RepID=A0A1V4KD06_PATFA|nr:hypothetical protein AV530_014088 [Patagioenas fasciata monilis]
MQIKIQPLGHHSHGGREFGKDPIECNGVAGDPQSQLVKLEAFIFCCDVEDELRFSTLLECCKIQRSKQIGVTAKQKASYPHETR